MKFTFFNDEDIKAIRRKADANPDILKRVRESVRQVQDKLYIQPTGLATWGHYYLCPKHTVELKFNYDDPKHHVCPIDNEVFTGEPYDGAWWRKVLSINADACYNAAVAYLAYGDCEMLDLAKKILIAYAENYENYEIHGDIPYNKPGRFASQVLCEGLVVMPMALAYGIIKELFTKEERELIEEKLLLPSAQHLNDYMTHQIHNHEVVIASAIGIIGLVCEREDIVDKAVNSKYGLKYQFDNAVLEDGLWFEGSIGYHFFALSQFFEFEARARYSEFSLLSNPHYRDIIKRMLDFPFKVRRFDGIFLKFNDGSTRFLGKDKLFEYAYSVFKNDATLASLKLSYGDKERSSLAYLLYGEESLPEIKIPEFTDYISECGSKLAVINGSCQRQLVFKNLPYGGEHDHYDRLSLSFSAFGEKLSCDLGTSSGYGAPLHYAYFKNTATHNTVCINGENMPPCDTKVNEYTKGEDGSIFLDAEIDFNKEFTMPDSFTIKQWSNEAYENVKMRRIVKWEEDFFIDVFKVEDEKGGRKDYVWHTEGELINTVADLTPLNSVGDGPQSHLHSSYIKRGCGSETYTYEKDGVYLDVHSLTDSFDVITAKGPNNPSTSDISYLLLRTNAKNPVFVNVFEAHKGVRTIKNVNVSIQNAVVTVAVEKADGSTKEYSFSV